MPRVKRGTVRRAKRKKLLGLAKGYYANKSKLYRAAKESVDTALKYAFVGRRNKKRDFRRLWVVRINAAAREHGLTYGQFINGLKNAGVTLNRKSLSELAIASPAAFATLAAQAKAAAKIAVKSAKNAAAKERSPRRKGAKHLDRRARRAGSFSPGDSRPAPDTTRIEPRAQQPVPVTSPDHVQSLSQHRIGRDARGAVRARARRGEDRARRAVGARPLPRAQEQHRRVLDAADCERRPG